MTKWESLVLLVERVAGPPLRLHPASLPVIVDRGKEHQPLPVDSHPVLVDSPSVGRILPEPALWLSSDGCFTIDYVEQHRLAAGSSEETAERMGLLDFQHLPA